MQAGSTLPAKAKANASASAPTARSGTPAISLARYASGSCRRYSSARVSGADSENTAAPPAKNISIPGRVVPMPDANRASLKKNKISKMSIM